MKILVTGGAGFIGSHVVEEFLRQGHQVTVLDDLSTGRRSQVPREARFVRGDIRSPRLEGLFRRGRFDVVNHHAAQIDVRHSVADPQRDADVNIVGWLNLLHMSIRHHVKKVIFAASGGTYYGECLRPAREEDPPRPLSPYGVSKLAGEHYVRAFGALHGLRWTVLRYGNVFGPRQDPHGEAGVVAIFSQRLLENKSVKIFGTGKQERDYVFVGDVARANGLAVRRGDGQAVNIGTGRAVSVLKLWATLQSVADFTGKHQFFPARSGELTRSVLGIGLAKKVLGWAPRLTLADGLGRTLEHFRTQF